jgi:hypothetical protein
LYFAGSISSKFIIHIVQTVSITVRFLIDD